MKHILVAAFLIASVPAWAADAPAPTAPKTVTLDVSDKPVGEVLKDIASATGETILAEKLVSGTVTAGIKDATVEKALDAITKSLHIQWRKISVPQGSVLAKDADALAAQMRTVLALRFPDIVISPAGSGGSFVHVQRESAANEIVKTLPPAAGFKTIYLVTDDEKAYKKEVKDESKKKVAKYIQASKEQMDAFLAMSPEERKAVLRESMNLVNQLGPEGMQQMMSAVFELDPEYMAEMNRMSMKAMFSMNPDALKNMLRMSMRQQMQMMQEMTPEQMQMMMDIAKEIAGEMQSSGQPTPPPTGQ